jgi:two-component system, sensor histidine kinase and response regulator
VVRERLVSRMIQQIHKTRDITEILETSTEEVRKLLKCEHVLVYRFRADCSRGIAHESCEAGCTPLMAQQQQDSWVDPQLPIQPCGCHQDRKSLTVTDIHQLDDSDEHIACLEKCGIRAFMVVPIFTGEQIWGLMGAYQSGSPRDWSVEDLSFLERIGGQLGVALQQAELLKQLEQAKEKADSANLAKGTFLAHMSHELRTPLNAILGFSQLMHRDRATTPSQRETLNIINRSGNHLLSLINDILEMSKIEAGKLVLQESDLDLFSLCDSIHDLFGLKAESKGLALYFERAEDLPRYIYSDERKLRQILMNLISNSLKFTQSGSITIKLWQGESIRLNPMTSLSNAPVRLWFSIEDTGEGIDAQDMDQLFDAFSQTESGRSLQEGTGLGLPISREFVQLMGGELTLKSDRHRGTEARFSIVVPPVVGKFTPSPPNQRVISLSPYQPEYRILVVEDRLENRELLTQLLTCVGFSVRTATNGELAIAQWQDWKPHLIWMDLQMPVMNGFTATRKIRHLEALQQQSNPDINSAINSDTNSGTNSGTTPNAKTVTESASVSRNPDRETFILAITASAFEETRTLTLEAGFDDFIRKPYQEDLPVPRSRMLLRDPGNCLATIHPIPSSRLPPGATESDPGAAGRSLGSHGARGPLPCSRHPR